MNNNKQIGDVLSRKTVHDLKNIFATLIANAELLSEGGSPQEDESRIQRILNICAKGISLVEELQGNGTSAPGAVAGAASDIAPESLHVLLVEGQPAMLELEEIILLSQGYSVKSCLGAGEAFAVFLENPHAINVVLTVQEMAGRTGTQLIEEIHGICPGLPCILITGDGSFQALDKSVRECCTLLVKPVSRTTLLAAITENTAG